MDAPPEVFKGLLDRFNGVTVDSHKEFEDAENFPEKLESKCIISNSMYLQQVV